MIVKLKMRILMLMGSLMLLAFAVNVGIASADGPHLGPDNNDLSKSGAAAPHIIAPGPGAGSANGATHGFNWDFENRVPDLTNPAVIGITHNPLCPLHPADPE